MKRPDVIVLRHFSTKLNEHHVSRGWMDVGIDKEAAEKLAPGVASVLRQQGVDSLVSSDLPRATQTMKMVADEMDGDVSTDSTRDLRTWNTGDKVAGKPEKETVPLRERYMKNSEIEMPGGESWDDFMERFGVELRKILKQRENGEEIALVGHGHHLMALKALLSEEKANPADLKNLDEAHKPGGVYAFLTQKDGSVKMETLFDPSAKSTVAGTAEPDDV